MHSPTSIAAERVSEPTRRRADYGEVSAAIPLSRRNLPGLDGVRGLAILAVMLTHISLQTIALNPMLRGLFALGWSGVDLFFVLSGFLITGILLDTHQCANYFRSFYARRVLRIFPLYFGFLTVALLVFPYVVSPEFMPAPSHRWMYVCYVANWLPHAQWHVLTHFWSLCVEEQFYFIWPLVVLLFGPRRLLPLIAGLELTMVCGRSWWLLTHSHVATQYTATVAAWTAFCWARPVRCWSGKSNCQVGAFERCPGSRCCSWQPSLLDTTGSPVTTGIFSPIHRLCPAGDQLCGTCVVLRHG